MSDWKKDEGALDELLKQMPKFTDHRSKEDVYKRVKLEVDAQVKEEKQQSTHVAVSKWLPIVASVASILVLTFLVSSYINDKDTFIPKDNASNSFEEKSSKEESMRSMDAAQEAATVNEGAQDKTTDEMTTMSSLVAVGPKLELIPLNKPTSVYEQNLKDGTVFHFSFLENALSIPVTIIISKEQIEADFPNMVPNSLQLYERYAAMIDEEALGFEEYHPYKGYFVGEGKILKHYLPADHGYDIAPGTSGPYWSSINEVFTDFDSLMRLNEDGTPLKWDQVGTLDKPSPLLGENAHQNYFKYTSSNGEIYLSPNFGKRFDTLSEAFVDMKSPENDIYTSVIPSTVTYSYRDDNGTAIIQFDESLDLKTLDQSDATRMIEAFALTAASFGTEVKLENVKQQEWEEFDLTKPLPVPLGPNGFIMSVK